MVNNSDKQQLRLCDQLSYDYMLFVFINLASIAAIGVSFTFLIVGNCMEKTTFDEEDDDCEDGDGEEEDIYENKYYDELNQLNYLALDKTSLYNLRYETVCESSPNGDIIMTYNSNTGTFWYYCDNKDSIKFNTLDAVARKFTIENNCKCICVNYKEEFDKTIHQSDYSAVLKQLKSNHVKKNGGSTDVKSVYAKFKTYNSGKDNDSSSSSDKSNRPRPKHLTNRFSYKGKINEYIPFEKKKVDRNFDNEHINFASFKKLQQKPMPIAEDISRD